MKIEISKIKIDVNTQSRVEIKKETVSEYAEDLKGGAKFPPVVLFHDGKNYYVGDGWHRIYAYKEAGLKSIPAEIKKGSRREAVLYSVGSNTTHGLRRTNEDKRKSVMLLLEDKEWAMWSNREIARRSAVGKDLVDRVRKELIASGRIGQIGRKKAKRGGKEYVMETANIGKKANKNAPETKINNEINLNEPENENEERDTEPTENKKGKVLFKIFGWEIIAKKMEK